MLSQTCSTGQGSVCRDVLARKFLALVAELVGAITHARPYSPNAPADATPALTMLTVCNGRFAASVATRPRLSTISMPLTTRPKMVCFPANHVDHRSSNQGAMGGSVCCASRNLYGSSRHLHESVSQGSPSSHGVGARVMKNCEPLVSLPAFACVAKTKRRANHKRLPISAVNYPRS
jgi:hypothetical protein